MNPNLVTLVDNLLQHESMAATSFNEQMKNETNREKLNKLSQRLVWVLDKLAKDPNLYKQGDFGKLLVQYSYFEGQSREPKTL